MTAAIQSDPVWQDTKGDYYKLPKEKHPLAGVAFGWSVLGLTGYDLAYPASGAAIAAHMRGLPADVFVAFDPGPLAADIETGLLQSVLARAALVSLNERESEALGPIDAPTIVLRQGRRGATIHRRGEADVHVDAVPLGSIADTSGAGDVHVGANLAALAMGVSWPDAVLREPGRRAVRPPRNSTSSGPIAGSRIPAVGIH